MKISCIKNSYIPNFNAKYKTIDVLRLASGCPYKGKGLGKIVKSLTGIDMYSDEFRKSIAPSETYAIVTFALEDICVNKIIEQDQRLKDVRDSFTGIIRNSQSSDARDSWFEQQLKRFGKTIELEPFTVTKEELKKAYSDFANMINYAQECMYKNF